MTIRRCAIKQAAVAIPSKLEFSPAQHATNRVVADKPFNPLLGETYEFVDANKNFRFFAEQVSHHPPIGAAIAECGAFDYWQDQMIKTKYVAPSYI